MVIFMVARVIVEIGVKAVDRLFDYVVPIEFRNDIKIGCRVLVPFGHQVLEGFVMELVSNVQESSDLRNIIKLIDLSPVLNNEMLEIGEMISDTTLCSKISAYQAMLPKALKASFKTDMKVKMDKYLTLQVSEVLVVKYIEDCRYEGQIKILRELLEKKEIKIVKLDSSIKTLIKKGFVKVSERVCYRYFYDGDIINSNVILNNEQQRVVDSVLESKNTFRTFLLYGITGSGKTEVYISIIENVLKDGKKAIVLVPEISLTPQIVSRFVSRFGNDVAILHSGLSDAEKYDEYRKIQDGLVNIVVGARSAVFAPLKNLGVIIIDEEHSSTYKQDNHPRYHARDVAIYRGNYHQCPVVLGSATPSLESMARAFRNVYELLTLEKRAGGGKLPFVHIVDMKREVSQGRHIFSELLDRKIKEKLKRGEQIILFLNRRGYTSIEMCNSCGEVVKCPNCDISLTYHKTSDMLRCHYCGYAKKKDVECSKCHSTDLKDYGLGTQKLEEELVSRYQARVVRMDVDTTSKKGAHQKIIDSFGRGEYDILVGTQMIAKGLDFHNVTLVGVINADASLNIPDFRSSERTFQLLCQVSGRAGRGEKGGEVVIQTYNGDHYSIVLSATHNYLAFYKEEMKIRKQLNYSPYYYIILVKISSRDYEASFKEARLIGDYLRNNLSNGTFVLGPTMASVFRVDNVYHQQCIIKYKKDEKLKSVLLELDRHYKANRVVKVEIDVEPNRL